MEAAKAGIPMNAYDALVCFAPGYSVAETEAQLERGKPAPMQEDDFAAALKTDESRHAFWLVEDDEERRRMLDEQDRRKSSILAQEGVGPPRSRVEDKEEAA